MEVNQEISITINDSGNINSYTVPYGNTVEQALGYLGITLSSLDYTEPLSNTLITEGITVRIFRVIEEFEIVDAILPFEQQSVKNESIPEGQTILIQSGVNGTVQSTFRILYEDGVELSRTLVKTEVLDPGKPEIIMMGVQSPFAVIQVLGRIAYISEGNAWIIEENTGNRRVVASSGDLDGRVFSISPDREWLLFSRAPGEDAAQSINSLWIVNITGNETQPIDTTIRNVVHYAEWVPDRPRSIAYSTVEPVSTPPGWQANNDLHIAQFDQNGKVTSDKILLETNSGGQYGWWGSSFSWSPDGGSIAYSRPDSVGLVDVAEGILIPLIEFIPYQPKTDWAWVPDISWSPDGSVLYTVIDYIAVSQADTDGGSYDLVSLTIENPKLISIVQKTGLFSYPVTSPLGYDNRFSVSFLSSIISEESETSRYALWIMDRDGSNQSKLYPTEGIQGLAPQIVAWSPSKEDGSLPWVAFISQGNLIFVEPATGLIKQITGDGSITRVIWR